MSEATGSAPAESAASAPGSSAAGDVGQSSGAVDSGHAPGFGDAGAVGSAPDSAAAQTPAEYVFAGRRYRDQKHAESAIQAQIGRTPEVQRQNALYQRQLAEMQQEMRALRAMAAAFQGGQGGQGRQPEIPQSLADQLNKSGDLEWFSKLAEDPEIGLKGALYAFTQAQEKQAEAREQAFLEKHVQPLLLQQQFGNAMSRVSGVHRQLQQEFPELDDSNEAPGADEARQEILGIIQNFPREMLVNQPELVLSCAVLLNRHMNGTPVFGQPPGSSGSPSAYAAEAAEAAAGMPLQLDGSGTPRPRAGGHESVRDRMRRENKELNSKVVRTPSGRPLFPVG